MISLCNKCNRNFFRYPETFCRRNFVSRSKKQCENQVIHDFLQEIQSNSSFCNDFINWIPNSDVNYVRSHKKTGVLEIFLGTQKPLSSLNIVFKVFQDSQNINQNTSSISWKMSIPFYGLKLYPKTLDYAIIMKHAVHDHIHSLNLIHHDFHCKNILVDEDNKIFICDFGFLVIQIHSQELTSFTRPFDKEVHDANLALKIVTGSHPEIINDTPKLYKDVMKKCWNNDPFKRPDTSKLLQMLSGIQQNQKIIQNFRYINEQDTSNTTLVADSSTSINTNYQTRLFDIDLKLGCDSDKQETNDFSSLPTRSFFIESLMFSTLSSLYNGASNINDQVPSLLDLNKLFTATDEIFNPDAHK
ncbi:kinase-like protein [Gigaspora margarita]|uniref:Kinase-like protein n=1 Tax=Gigaspora margarita TaxID=4874 RepID=A0A8H4EHF1_GIGMA|nr:kinase-like protein [Gigaspora margarita]